jgi:hypothetical protein
MGFNSAFKGLNAGVCCDWHEEGSTKTGNIRVRSNNEARFCNHCCSGKAVDITYYGGVFVALGTQHARNFVICGLPLSTIYFPHYLINGTMFENSY